MSVHIHAAVRVVTLLLLLQGGAGSPLSGQRPVTVEFDSLSSLIQRRIEAGAATDGFWIGGRRLTAERALPAFYTARGFRPAWVGDDATARLLDGLVEAIRESALDGLDPADYHLAQLAASSEPSEGGGVSELADLELLATDAFLVLGSHLLLGRVDPTRVTAEWLANRRSADMSAVLSAALENGDIGGALDDLRPVQPEYRRMRWALDSIRSSEARGGWIELEPGPTLRSGDVDPRVRVLRRKLSDFGDLAAPAADHVDQFDADVEAGVRAFQRRHGLEPDGAVGTATREALNAPPQARIEQLLVNLERWRWMPDQLGDTHILVNIPDFSVTVRERGEAVLRLRAIVGREYRQTPVFTGRMTYLVLAPFWHVPPGIAANDKFPMIRRDPSYIREQRMTLIELKTNEPVDPSSVDWGSLTPGQFNQRYRLRQDPGPTNALGEVKFMFPNQYNVYLHDTPSRELFGRTDRGFSSGCIRVERPLELAEYLLRGAPAWTADRIRETIARGREATVTLPIPVPVHLQYWTAFVDDRGAMNYRRDLYGRDAAVLMALRSDPPGV